MYESKEMNKKWMVKGNKETNKQTNERISREMRELWKYI